MTEMPEIPEPEKAPTEEKPPPSQADPRRNGNGGVPHQAPKLDNEKLVKWIEATDKEIKKLQVFNLVLCGAVLFLIAANAKIKVDMPA